MEQQEKPFKTIEVIDAKTRQVCKVACMSCIRGHRTTSCGIPVCRSKIFWTVKRPGRPSNSCNCRYGATGGCKCVVARNACPHKSKKGEKRSGQCRCDEQGRYCCLIEPEQWELLLALRKPYVEFFNTREALEARQTTATQHPPPRTTSDAFSNPLSQSTPLPLAPSTPNTYPVPIAPNTQGAYYQKSTTLTPRFGMTGIGVPLDPTHAARDVLIWHGQAPPASQQFDSQFQFEDPLVEPGSCCLPIATSSTASAQLHQSPVGAPGSHTDSMHRHITSTQLRDVDGQHLDASSPSTAPTAPSSNFERLQADYFNYQFPSAICQNCGLNGCTCRNCPPVFQNFGTTSWAQCCGRKHARDVQPTPPPVAKKIPRTETWATELAVPTPDVSPGGPSEDLSQAVAFSSASQGFGGEFVEADLRIPPDVADLDSFDIDHELLLTDDSALSEFLLANLDQPAQDDEKDGAVDDLAAGEGSIRGGSCCCGD